jgi:hypothetical protein
VIRKLIDTGGSRQDIEHALEELAIYEDKDNQELDHVGEVSDADSSMDSK